MHSRDYLKGGIQGMDEELQKDYNRRSLKQGIWKRTQMTEILVMMEKSWTLRFSMKNFQSNSR